MVKRSKKEKEILFKMGKVLSNLLDDILPNFVRPELPFQQIEEKIENYILENNMLTIKNFFIDGELIDQACHISSDDEIIHGVHYKNRLVRNNCFLKIDIVVFSQGIYVDAARTYIVGKMNEVKTKFYQDVKQLHNYVIGMMREGDKISKLAQLTNDYIRKNRLKYVILREYCSHFIDEKLHSYTIPSLKEDIENDISLKEGFTFTFEPIICFDNNYKLKIENNTPYSLSLQGDPLYDFTLHMENTYIVENGNIISLTGEIK